MQNSIDRALSYNAYKLKLSAVEYRVCDRGNMTVHILKAI